MRPWPIIALALAFVPAAEAQAAPVATLSLDITPGPADVDLGSTHVVPFTVTFALSNVVCASASQVKVPVTIQDEPSPLAGVKGAPKPDELAFNIPAGSYASAQYSKDASGDLAVSVASDASGGHEHTFVLTASYAGGMPAGCQGTGSLPATVASGEHMIMTGASASGATYPTHQMSDGSSMQGDQMSSTNKTPGPALWLLALGIVGATLLRQR